MKKAICTFLLIGVLMMGCEISTLPVPQSAITPLPTSSPTITLTPDPRCNFGTQYEYYSTYKHFLYDRREEGQDYWEVTTPEEQGLDSEILLSGVPELEKSTSLMSFIVVRHGAIVFEQYYNLGRNDRASNIHSVSKSILSALGGIAIEKGYLRLNQPVREILPEYFSEEYSRKDRITVQHLLSMSTGLDWRENISILDGDDWVAATLALPLVHNPGSAFNYSTPVSHVFSAVLTRATGMSTCAFAYKYLFDPIGITLESWPKDPQGIHVGGNSIYITPREMARFGLLFLNNGQWDGQQVVPAEWVKTSLAPKRRAYYGFYWWIDRLGKYRVYQAIGYGGQWICLIPDLDLMVVSTADTRLYIDDIDMRRYLRYYIVSAVTDLQ